LVIILPTVIPFVGQNACIRNESFEFALGGLLPNSQSRYEQMLHNQGPRKVSSNSFILPNI
jgi:hypothetical protein